MNCANHPDTPAVAYCRTCGKPLCANCTRSVQGVIYCETCLADRLHGTQPPIAPPPTSAGFVPLVPPVPGVGSAPNPALAGLLSVFPGVGSVYAGQYAKGLAYMGIFILLILGCIHVSGLIFGLGLGFFVVYQFIDAVQTAKALQMGQPAPDPLGMGQIFSPGQKVDSSKIPLGAIILIGLGVLLLLWNILDFDFWNLLLPAVLLGLGIWLAATRLGLTGHTPQTHVHPRTLMGPAILITLGCLFLVQTHGPGFGRTWPILLLVIGLIKLLGANSPVGMQPPMQPPMPPPGRPVEGEVQPPSSEVRNG